MQARRYMMAASTWFLGLVLAWGILQMSYLGADGYCSGGSLHITESSDGSPYRFCLHNDIEFEIGSRIRDRRSCVACSCDWSGMDCCGYGSSAGVIGAPDGCKVISRDCVPYVVREADETIDCFTGGPAQPAFRK